MKAGIDFFKNAFPGDLIFWYLVKGFITPSNDDNIIRSYMLEMETLEKLRNHLKDKYKEIYKDYLAAAVSFYEELMPESDYNTEMVKGLLAKLSDE